ncbi:hypothetical protein [Pseudomonas sp. BMS12]|uniref:hypothetical protein n=1 Tax=Pseudomonas sp. BMS12 TaxID=1796033 RepID=UPI00083B46CC|nr:hypothetical protein [Pseudomonas sp. BMS12]
MSSDTATDTDATGDEPLDDQQRIERLEKAGKLNRILIFALAGVLLLTLLAWLLIALLGSTPEEDEPAASQASVQALQQELGALQLQVGTLQQQLQEQQKLIVMVQQQMPKPASVAPTAEASQNERETVSMVAKTLIGQEHNYQESLSALKVGMRDLARMIAGSRSWLAFYEESLAKPMADSQARVKALQAWEAKQTK